ncbi:UbiA family prenyltransferase [Streptomyces sp. NPDC054796]
MSARHGAAVRAHLETWRPYTLAYPGLLGLAGAACGGGAVTAEGVLAAWLCPTLGWLGGHYLGDYFDRELDAIGKPQRPIPSGRLSAGTARACGVGAVLLAALIVLGVNWPVVGFVVLALAGIVAYSRVLKGRGILGNGVRGLLSALAVLFGAAVTAPPGHLPSWGVLFVALTFLSHDTASNLVGTLRDVEGDRAGGYLTLPVRHGLGHAVRVASALYVLALAAGTCHLVLAAHPVAAATLLVLAAVAGACALVPLLRSAAPTPRAALRAHEVLVGERLVLAAAFTAGGWGALPALCLLVPVLAVSLLTQRHMRARHEFPAPAGGDREGATAPPTAPPASPPRLGTPRTAQPEG